MTFLIVKERKKSESLGRELIKSKAESEEKGHKKRWGKKWKYEGIQLMRTKATKKRSMDHIYMKIIQVKYYRLLYEK